MDRNRKDNYTYFSEKYSGSPTSTYKCGKSVEDIIRNFYKLIDDIKI